jgi:hypothetical protein
MPTWRYTGNSAVLGRGGAPSAESSSWRPTPRSLCAINAEVLVTGQALLKEIRRSSNPYRGVLYYGGRGDAQIGLCG